MNIEFQEYRRLYFLSETTTEMKEQLILSMKKNLKKRCDEDCNSFEDIDGTVYSLDSSNVSDLLAIDGILNRKERTNFMTDLTDETRLAEQRQNQFGPNNPYPGN